MIESQTYAEQTSRRQFTVAPAIIRHLIDAQAGTLEKAIVESVMNSIDAGAEAIDITLDGKSFTIADDGQGFRTREEILECFEVFGFDHEVPADDRSRVYGRFGIGRAQTWAYASTLWRTRTFKMDVDIRARGLDYELSENLPDEKGLRIEATLYQPMNNYDRARVEEGVSKLCRYCTVPVTFNGKRISIDPGKEKWTFQTDDAYVQVTDANSLRVYNQGIYVCEVSAGQAGIGGKLVTKRGANIALNMSRNMVLTQQCPVWKRVMARCAKEAGKRVIKQKKRRLQEHERAYLATLTSDPERFYDAIEEPIFTLCDDRHFSWTRFAALQRGKVPLTVAEPGSRVADVLLQNRSAIVLSSRTLERFGAESVTHLAEILQDRWGAAEDTDEKVNALYLLDVMRGRFGQRIYDDIKKIDAYRQWQAQVVPDKDLTPRQREFLRAMENANHWVTWAIQSYYRNQGAPQRVGTRALRIGKGDGFEAYTDGKNYIALCDHVVEKMADAGLGGFNGAVLLLLHEYLHSVDTAGSHVHDADFYQAFHDIAIDQADKLEQAATKACTQFILSSKKMSLKAAKVLDKIENTRGQTAQPEPQRAA